MFGVRGAESTRGLRDCDGAVCLDCLRLANSSAIQPGLACYGLSFEVSQLRLHQLRWRWRDLLNLLGLMQAGVGLSSPLGPWVPELCACVGQRRVAWVVALCF